jgi:hypothetical protein
MPPAFAELVQALAPTVVDILRRGSRQGVLDEEAFTRLAADVRELGISSPEPGLSFLADGHPMGQILKRVNETGVASLLASLSSGGDAPPPAVAQLIESLMRDAALGPGATAEDLALHLAKQLRVSPPSTDSTK